MTNQEIKDAVALLITDPANKQNTAAKVREALDVLIDNMAPGWIRRTITLTQEEVRTMTSANGGYGFKIFETAGASKAYQMRDVIFRLSKTGGSFSIGGISIINGGAADTIMEGATDEDTNQFAAILAPNPGFSIGYILNEEIFLFNNTDSPDYEGTATLTFEYRLLDFS